MRRPDDVDRNELGGGALVVGYVLFLAVLYRTPGSALARATADPQSGLYFLVLPALGIAAGVYGGVEGPYSGVSSFLAASYLGVAGVTLAFGAVLAPAPGWLPLGLGLALLALAVVALVASVSRFATRFGLPAGIDFE